MLILLIGFYLVSKGFIVLFQLNTVIFYIVAEDLRIKFFCLELINATNRHNH